MLLSLTTGVEDPPTRMPTDSAPLNWLLAATPPDSSPNKIPTATLSMIVFPVSSGAAEPPTWMPTARPVTSLSAAVPVALPTKLIPTSPPPAMTLPSTLGDADPVTWIPATSAATIPFPRIVPVLVSP